MTSEERMKYFQGQKKRVSSRVEQQDHVGSQRKLLKSKIFVLMLLMIAFLSLDYTGYKIQGIGSKEIIHEVTSDFNFKKLNFHRFIELF